jgi:hypothetical protein
VSVFAQDDGWYFWDENCSDYHGPYETEIKARVALDLYGKRLMVETVLYKLVDLQTVHVEPCQGLRRDPVVGQSVRFNFKDYKILSLDYLDKILLVIVEPCEICTNCGGIVKTTESIHNCRCP